MIFTTIPGYATTALAIVLLGACAGHEETASDDTPSTVSAVQDFIAVRGLEEVKKIPTSGQDRYQAIENEFLIYTGRRGIYLLEFTRRCYELDDQSRIVADERWNAKYMYSRVDTIRGCRIARMFALTEAEADELANIGDAPGSRN